MEYHHRHMEHGPAGAPAQTGAPGPHWGYSGGWGAPAPRTSKRSHSESDDCDDVFSEESSKDAQCASPGGTGGDSCQLLTRKRRRGVIEKKRRDRINTSLTELKRLVPTAYEKQGSAKLEKAEILQLTVDHLKMLHAKGLDTFAYDPQRYAMDYHSIGFRECASEVARYLVSCEGLDIQDPLRLRLMSHLQCFAAQRELAAKSCANPWSYAAPAQPYAAHGHSAALNGPHPSSLNAIPPAAPISNPIPSSNLIGNIPTHHPNPTHETIHNYTDISNSCPTSRLDATPSTATSSSASLTPLTTVAPSGATLGYPAPAPHYPAPAPHYAAGGAYHHPPPPVHHQYNQNSSKPYRPWGAELAY